MHMSTAEIARKNFDLAARFTGFTVKHPEIVESLPPNASVVFVTHSKFLNEHNLRLGRSIRRKEKKPVYMAIFSGKKWKIEKLGK